MHNPFVEATAETPDEELVCSARSGNQEAAERLFLKHQPWVFNIAVRMLVRRADAEDATQDVFMKAFKSLSTFRGDSKFSTWLYRIAVNHILNVRKGRWIASQSVFSFQDAALGL